MPLVGVLVDRGIIEAHELPRPQTQAGGGSSYSEFVAWINEGDDQDETVVMPPPHDDRVVREQREKIEALTAAIRVQREKLHRATDRIASLERRLDRCHHTTEGLVIASRGCVTALHELHSRVKGRDGEEAILPMSREVRKIAELVRELRTETSRREEPHSAGTAR